MRYTQLTAALPTRTTLRKTARKLRRLATSDADSPAGGADILASRAAGVRAFASERAAQLAVLLVAAAAFVTGATAITVAVGVVLASLPAHPLALLAAAATTTVAFYALPLLAVRAATRAAVTTE